MRRLGFDLIPGFDYYGREKGVIYMGRSNLFSYIKFYMLFSRGC